jgi:hypothetical protein
MAPASAPAATPEAASTSASAGPPGPYASGDASSQPQRAARRGAGGAFFVDPIVGAHVSPGGPGPLLAARRMAWSGAHGWCYDAWVEDPGRHALSGSNSRFALPAIALRIRDLASDAAGPAAAGLAAAAAAAGSAWAGLGARAGGGHGGAAAAADGGARGDAGAS